MEARWLMNFLWDGCVAALEIDGRTYGHYYLYSEPFTAGAEAGGIVRRNEEAAPPAETGEAAGKPSRLMLLPAAAAALAGLYRILRRRARRQR